MALPVVAAQASTVTVGSVLPPTFTPSTFGQVGTTFNTALPEKGANLSSPVAGAVVRWRIQGAGGGPYYLRVLRPNGNGAFQAVGTSAPATPSGSGIQTFTTNLPIHAGDLIGVDPTNASDGIGVATVPGASYARIVPPLFEGATVAPSETTPGSEIELNAEVQPVPVVTSLSPSSGSIAGGTVVTISGRDLNGASAVKFGSTSAASFTVESENQITATAPPGALPGSVDVTVTTVAGNSPVSVGDRFSYRACVVPGLVGKKLKLAKRRLRPTECELGHVAKRHARPSKVGKVIRQVPRPGSVLAPGAEVNLTVGIRS